MELQKSLSINLTFLGSLIEGGETTTTEFKLEAPRYAELAGRLCGMANGAGGYVIFGVTDKTWQVVGVKNVAETTDTILQAVRHCKPSLRLEPAQPEVVEIKGQKVVVARVPPNNGRLYQASGIFWIRRGTHTIPLEADELEGFFHRRGSLTWETRPVELATLADLDWEVVRAYAEQRQGRRNNQNESKVDQLQLELLLQRIGCAVSAPNLEASTSHANDSSVVRPTNAGLLLFGREPQEFLLQAEVTCVLFGDKLGVRRYLDRRILRGRIMQQVDQAEEFFIKHMSVAASTVGFRRVDEPEYPLEALREAIVNALVHRDYSLAGEAIRIFYYTDRVEIHSPGLLMPGLSVEELSRGYVPSRPRNPMLANVLRDMPGGYMERLGSGISFMINQMRGVGYPDPQFIERNEVMVTFYKEVMAANNSEKAATNSNQDTSSGKAANDRVVAINSEAKITTLKDASELYSFENKSAEPERVQSRRQEVALEYVQQHGSITNKEYRAITGVSESTAMRDLEALVEQGTLRAVGHRRSRKYLR